MPPEIARFAHDFPGNPERVDTVEGRTRIVLADVARARAVRQTAVELTQQSAVGDALLRGLIRTQLAHALRLAAVVVVGLGGLPLLFAAAPSVAGSRLLGVSLPWLLLGLAAYPFLFAIGAVYVRLAERTEAEFTDLVERPDR
jgi:hypothetical protein